MHRYVVSRASAPVLSKIPAEEADPQLAEGPSEPCQDLAIVPTQVRFPEKRIAKRGLGWSWNTSSGFLSPTSVP